MAVLIASVLHEMHVQTALMKLPEHMAVGIAGTICLPARTVLFLYNATRYFYQETTSGGLGICELPDE